MNGNCYTSISKKIYSWHNTLSNKLICIRLTSLMGWMACHCLSLRFHSTLQSSLDVHHRKDSRFSTACLEVQDPCFQGQHLVGKKMMIRGEHGYWAQDKGERALDPSAVILFHHLLFTLYFLKAPGPGPPSCRRTPLFDLTMWHIFR